MVVKIYVSGISGNKEVCTILKNNVKSIEMLTLTGEKTATTSCYDIRE